MKSAAVGRTYIKTSMGSALCPAWGYVPLDPARVYIPLDPPLQGFPFLDPAFLLQNADYFTV